MINQITNFLLGNRESFPFQALPRDLQLVIIGFLDFRDVCKFCRVSKHFLVLANEETVWKSLCERRNFARYIQDNQGAPLSWKETFRIKHLGFFTFVQAPSTEEEGGVVLFENDNRKITKLTRGSKRYNGIWGNLQMKDSTGIYEWFIKVEEHPVGSYLFVGLMEAPDNEEKMYKENTTCIGFERKGFSYAKGYKWVN